MTDLTKIDRPFGLLDEATQKALRECGGPWEVFTERGWDDDTTPVKRWSHMVTRRQKPQPPKPREFWVVEYSMKSFALYTNLAPAEMAAKLHGGTVIHVREVMPE